MVTAFMLQVVQDTMATGIGNEDLQGDRGKGGECGGGECGGETRRKRGRRFKKMHNILRQM